MRKALLEDAKRRRRIKKFLNISEWVILLALVPAALFAPQLGVFLVLILLVVFVCGLIAKGITKELSWANVVAVLVFLVLMYFLRPYLVGGT